MRERGEQFLGSELGDERVAEFDERGELRGVGAEAFELPEAVQDGAAEREKRQRLERAFYRALSSETELPGPCKTWELIAEHQNSIKPILFWAARHKDEHPALRSLLSDLCDVWLDQQP